MDAVTVLAAEVGVARACAAMHVPRSSVYRADARQRHLLAPTPRPAPRPAAPLALSQAEVDHLAQLVRLHMRVHFLVNAAEAPTRRAIYRFFRASGEVGVNLILLSMADRLATEGYNLNMQTWERHLETCRVLLEAWWEHPEPGVKPPRLINGHDLQTLFGLPPGQRLGECLEAIQEAQAIGEIVTRDEAVAFAQNWISQVIEK